MSQIDLLIEAVNEKFANKYNSGSVLSNGKWYSVKRPVDLSVFKKGELYTVEIEAKESKGKVYENIVGVKDNVSKSPIYSQTISGAETVTVNVKESVNWDKIAEGKTKSLLYAAALQSPYLAMSTSDENFVDRSDALVNHFMRRIFGE